MKKIYKYKLNQTEFQTIPIPVNGLIRHLGVQDNDICLWVEIETSCQYEDRTFMIIGTGYDILNNFKSYNYIGTVQISHLVWHIYEIYYNLKPGEK